jgi:ATP-binding cassette subfamily F protein 3
MARLQREKAELEGQLSQPLAPADMAEAGKRLKRVDDELAQQEERWLHLSEQLEANASAET